MKSMHTLICKLFAFSKPLLITKDILKLGRNGQQSDIIGQKYHPLLIDADEYGILIIGAYDKGFFGKQPIKLDRTNWRQGNKEIHIPNSYNHDLLSQQKKKNIEE